MKFMKSIVLSLVLFLSMSIVYAQKKRIEFEDNLSWQQVKAKAKAENKFIFMDIFASWCGSCKWMDENVFDSEFVANFMNEKFVCVKMQTDSIRDAKCVESTAKIQRDYNIKSLPTFIFFDPEAKVVHKFVGAVSDSTFVKLAASALDPNKQYYTLLVKYKSGNLNSTQIPFLVKLSNYAGEVSEAKQIAEDYIDKYLLNLDERDLMTKGNLTFIRENLSSTQTRGFEFFMREREQINALLGPNKAEYAVRSIISKDYIPSGTNITITQQEWERLEKEVTSKFGCIGREMIYGRRMNYCLESKDWPNFTKYYVLYYKMALARPEWNINNMSWFLFNYSKDSTALLFACDVVMRYAMEEWYQNDPAAYDTYASLLYRCGRRDKAIDWQENAVKIAKGTPYEKTQQTNLIKMKRGEKTWF